MKKINLLFIILVATSIIACNQAPSNDIIKSAIKAHLKVEVPVRWSGSLLGGKNAQVQYIEIQEIGNYNEREKYWPVKARVKGNCDANYFDITKPKSFDKVGDFKIYKDNYGNWKASIMDRYR